MKNNSTALGQKKLTKQNPYLRVKNAIKRRLPAQTVLKIRRFLNKFRKKK